MPNGMERSKSNTTAVVFMKRGGGGRGGRSGNNSTRGRGRGSGRGKGGGGGGRGRGGAIPSGTLIPNGDATTRATRADAEAAGVPIAGGVKVQKELSAAEGEIVGHKGAATALIGEKLPEIGALGGAGGTSGGKSRDEEETNPSSKPPAAAAAAPQARQPGGSEAKPSAIGEHPLLSLTIEGIEAAALPLAPAIEVKKPPERAPVGDGTARTSPPAKKTVCFETTALSASCTPGSSSRKEHNGNSRSTSKELLEIGGGQQGLGKGTGVGSAPTKTLMMWRVEWVFWSGEAGEGPGGSVRISDSAVSENASLHEVLFFLSGSLLSEIFSILFLFFLVFPRFPLDFSPGASLHVCVEFFPIFSLNIFVSCPGSMSFV